MDSRTLLDISLTQMGLQSGLRYRRNLGDKASMRPDHPHFDNYQTDTELRLPIQQVRSNLVLEVWLSRNQMSLQDKVSLLDKFKQMLHFHLRLYSKSPPDT